MKLSYTVPFILLPLLLITGCGDVIKKDENGTKTTPGDVVNLPAEINNTLPIDINATIPPDINNTLPIVENNATFDFKDYFPKAPKTVNCSLSATGLSLSPTITYSGSESNISVESDYDGLDVFEYAAMQNYMSMDTQMQDRRTFTWFDDKFVYLKRENNVTSRALRYFDDNKSMMFSLDFKYDGNFTATSGSGQVTYTDTYINDSVFCIANALGDYNLSSTLYADALEINCAANHSKGGTLNNVDVTIYNDDYNSSTVFLPDIGIVSTKYVSRDVNFSVECQP